MYTGDPVIEAQVTESLIELRNSTGTVTKYFRESITYSCTRCQKSFESALAKKPSWCVVDIERGPDVTNRVVFGDLGGLIVSPQIRR